MPAICALVVAGLCLQAPYDRAVDLSAFFTPTPAADPHVVRRLGVRIEAYQSDNPVPHATDGLPESCLGASCVLYAKTCSGDGLDCEWDWGGVPGAGADFYTRTFIIKATSSPAMDRAERAISVEAVDGGPTIPLTQLSIASPLGYLPVCTSGQVDGSRCVNPFYGRIPDAVPRSRHRGEGAVESSPSNAR